MLGIVMKGMFAKHDTRACLSAGLCPMRCLEVLCAWKSTESFSFLWDAVFGVIEGKWFHLLLWFMAFGGLQLGRGISLGILNWGDSIDLET
jgi:hypothetical protein